MTSIHDQTFKELMSEKTFFTDFCRAYLPDDIKCRINWETLKLRKAGSEFVENSPMGQEPRSRYADVIYEVQYDDRSRSCFIYVHAEQQSTPDKLMALRFLNYNTALLLDYAKQHPKQPLPVVVSLLYFTGKQSPYPYSLDVYDLFADKALAEAHLLNPRLVDVKQQPDYMLAEHGVLFSAEVLFKLATIDSLQPAQYTLFFEAILQHKNDEIVLKSLRTLLYYAANALDCDQEDFTQRFIDRLPELEGTMRTMAEQWREQGVAQGMAQGAAQALLRRGVPIAEVAEESGLTIDQVAALQREMQKKTR